MYADLCVPCVAHALVFCNVSDVQRPHIYERCLKCLMFVDLNHDCVFCVSRTHSCFGDVSDVQRAHIHW
jgi:hypothetical protein